MIDQCPTSHKEGKPAHSARSAHELVGVSGQAYWRGLEDAADTPEFRDFLEKEFPSGASELLSGSRRTFLKLMGASVALAGAATMPGCRRPDHKILPYSKNVPENVIQGKALFYATTMPLPGGGAEGLLVETHEGRPTKVEGNPLHPVNQGKSSVWSQASVLELYDPDRLMEPVLVQSAGEAATGYSFIAGWANSAGRVSVKRADETDDAFKARQAQEAKVWTDWNQPGHFNQYDAKGGEGLAFVVDKRTSPTRDRLRDQIMTKWPKARWFVWDSVTGSGNSVATTAAFGAPMADVLDVAKANVVVSFDRDFLQYEPGALSNSRGWGASRRVLRAKQGMSRVYSIESAFTVTGGTADHRLRMAPSQIAAVVVAITQKVLRSRAARGSEALLGAINGLTPKLEGEALAHADEIAADLLNADNLGKSILICGDSQPAWVHGLCLAMNEALGNFGTTMRMRAMSRDEAVDSFGDLSQCVELLNAGKISTLVCLEVNPAYDAPGNLKFAEAMKKASTRVTLSVDRNETSELATVRLNGAHFLESWGDATASDGTPSLTQPMIAPLYDGRTQIEVLAMIAGLSSAHGHDLVRDTWKAKLGAADAEFEKRWRRSLHNGVIDAATASASKPEAMSFTNLAKLASGATLAPAPTQDKLEVAFVSGLMRDGRFANNGWMQELPDTASKMVWDNAALVSPKTARELGVMQSPQTDKKPSGRMVDLSLGGKSISIAVWAVPGLPENTVVLPLGYGRKTVGLVGAGSGFDVNPLRDSASPMAASGASIKKSETGDRWYPISVTQLHGSMEGRAIVRELDKPAWDTFGDEPVVVKPDSYGRPQPLSLGERLEGGELNHMPALVPVYQDPNRNREEGYSGARAGRPTPGVAAYDRGPQWGMTIDLSSCTGCNVCTIACQAENNIPIVGKIEVNKGREMAWIRVDRYFRGNVDEPDGLLNQPVACVHCEAAPCEVVCPVNATVHGSEGHNYMVYNRCIGTRYCANNCPYKVRRFNFFDYGVTKYQGGLKESIEGVVGTTVTENLPANHNLIPPRLRKQLDEITKFGKNPSVTVRSRGVMEKCSYCIQRTNEAKTDYKIGTGKRPEDFFPDGLVQTACQQACPTNSIVFGNLLDTTGEYDDTEMPGGKRKGSKVYNLREHNRAYLLLGYLATRPRTSHLVRVNNPNVELLSKLGKKDRLARIKDPFSHGGDHGGGHGKPGEHGGSGKSSEHSFIDPVKARGEDGYKLSLGVLPASGVHA
ncbi:MAG: TAT-variant-translocated molybdopterin oxidoreductase [Phycisphaerales bacterium]|nr:TAT-variant-translocated molybdopterin oxidoreductase [Phycisphaerales bacterium]